MPAAKPPTNFDLNQVVKDGDHTISVNPREAAEERTSRLRIEEHKAKWDVWTSVATKGLVGSLLMIVTMGALYILLSPSQTTNNPNGYTIEDKKQASTLLISTLTAGLGYAVGKVATSK